MRLDNNEYSVPVAYAHHRIVAKGACDEVALCHLEAALRVGAIRRDAIAQYLIPREEWRATAFSLDGHPHLREVKIQEVDMIEYGQLLAGGSR